MDLQLADDTATQLQQVSKRGRTRGLGVVSVLEKFSDASIAQDTRTTGQNPRGLFKLGFPAGSSTGMVNGVASG